MANPLQVFDYDHPLRKLVRSATDPDTRYLVDLSDPKYPAGRCDCIHFQTRIEPYVSRNEPAPYGSYCKHVNAALTVLLAQMRKQYPSKAKARIRASH